MLTKEKVHQIVDDMPDDFSTEDLIGRILLLQKIERAEKEIEDGEGTEWEDFKKEMDAW